jgi:short-subunit dehydrogenase
VAQAPFKDHVVVITGASSGIGAAVARRLAEQGACVVLAARRVDKLNAVAAECEQRGGKALVVPADVSDEGHCKQLIERAVEAYDRIDMVINNAGFTVKAALEDLPDLTPFKQVMDVNFMGSVYCTYYALPYLKQARGRIVGVSSLGAKAFVPLHTSYAASKCAMAGFFDTLRIELAKDGVSVTIVYPDLVVTEFAASIRTADGQRAGEEAAKEFYTDRMMSAEACARIILDAAARRKREVTTSMRGRLLGLMMNIAPALMDRLASKLLRAAHS